MSTSRSCSAPRATLCRALHALAAALGAVVISVAASAEISETPLHLGGGNVPGNLVLVPSVEWPTINSVANLGDYDEARDYVGYFDPDKCYLYAYDDNEALRYFYPVRREPGHRCSQTHGGRGEWSGNFLNWAATQTIDPFRSVLTGGYRVRDTAGETWLEKARHDGQGGANGFPNRRLPASGADETLVRNATPFEAESIAVRIHGLGNRMRFQLESGDLDDEGAGDGAAAPYDPAVVPSGGPDGDGGAVPGWDDPAELSVRVSVCVPGLLESNCRAYEGGHKPEGLIQQYAGELRLSVFGYLNDHSELRDGGVLRARQKFVGPTPGSGSAEGPARRARPW